MAAEVGHAPTRVYTSQQGDLHLNGAAVYDANELAITTASGGVSNAIAGVAAGYKLARGVLTTSSASDTVVTGLTTVVAVVATIATDLADGIMEVSASIGDQAGTPAAGSVLINTWKNISGTDPTPSAATSFSAAVNWVAIGS